MLTKKPIIPKPTKPQTTTPYYPDSKTLKANPLPPGRTRITVKYDAGYPNTLSLRGRGANLSWDSGIQLRNAGSDTWIWETDAPFSTAEFKVLINDQLYEEGENHTVRFGTHLEIIPHFVR